jgi:DNA-binding response OmpR family regulator
LVVLEDAYDECWGLTLTRLLREDGWAAELVFGLEAGVVRLGWPPAPQVIVLDVSGRTGKLRSLLDEARTLATPPRLIVVADEVVAGREVEALVSATVSKPIAAAELRRFLGNGQGATSLPSGSSAPS